MVVKDVLNVGDMAIDIVRVSRVRHIRKEHRTDEHSQQKEEKDPAAQLEPPRHKHAEQRKKDYGSNIHDPRQE